MPFPGNTADVGRNPGTGTPRIFSSSPPLEGALASSFRSPLGNSLGSLDSLSHSPFGSRETLDEHSPLATDDSAVQSTDSDALECRISCQRLGYFEDPFAEKLASRRAGKRGGNKASKFLNGLSPSSSSPSARSGQETQGHSPHSHSPLTPETQHPHGIHGISNKIHPVINKGTYCRTKFIDTIVHKFLSSVYSMRMEGTLDENNSKPQIISLGAGSDTRVFNMVRRAGVSNADFDYFELDFPEATAHKARIVASKDEFRELVANGRVEDGYGSEGFTLIQGGMGIVTPVYKLIPTDLREFSKTLLDLKKYGFNNDRPTLFIGECLFLYLDPQVTKNILDIISRDAVGKFGIVVAYDPINPDSPFGKTMVNYLSHRGIDIPGLKGYPTVESHISKFHESNFNQSFALPMVKFWETIPQGEKDRINKIEMLDELEEWNLLLANYCLSYGVISKDGTPWLPEPLETLYHYSEV